MLASPLADARLKWHPKGVVSLKFKGIRRFPTCGTVLLNSERVRVSSILWYLLARDARAVIHIPLLHDL